MKAHMADLVKDIVKNGTGNARRALTSSLREDKIIEHKGDKYRLTRQMPIRRPE